MSSIMSVSAVVDVVAVAVGASLTVLSMVSLSFASLSSESCDDLLLSGLALWMLTPGMFSSNQDLSHGWSEEWFIETEGIIISFRAFLCFISLALDFRECVDGVEG